MTRIALIAICLFAPACIEVAHDNPDVQGVGIVPDVLNIEDTSSADGSIDTAGSIDGSTDTDGSIDGSTDTDGSIDGSTDEATQVADTSAEADVADEDAAETDTSGELDVIEYAPLLRVPTNWGFSNMPSVVLYGEPSTPLNPTTVEVDVLGAKVTNCLYGRVALDGEAVAADGTTLPNHYNTSKSLTKNFTIHIHAGNQAEGESSLNVYLHSKPHDNAKGVVPNDLKYLDTVEVTSEATGATIEVPANKEPGWKTLYVCRRADSDAVPMVLDYLTIETTVY